MKKTKKKKKEPVPKISLGSEIDIANSILENWGYISQVMSFKKWFLKPVLVKYVSGKRYKYGKTLFNHLARLEKMRNIWIPEEVTNPVTALACLLERTTYPIMKSGAEALDERVASLCAQYKDLTGNNFICPPSVNPVNLIECIEKEIVKEFVNKLAKKKTS